MGTSIFYFTRINLIGFKTLKIVDDYVYYIIILIAILLSYLLVRPFINWFITLESVQLLSYLMSSLIIMLLLLFAMIYIDELQELFLSFLKITLECLAIFGVLLLLYRVYQRLSEKS